MPEEANPKLRVLYCEDDADTRDMMRFVLEAAGFEVVCPEDPADCLRLAKEQRFDAYLLDNLMPLTPGTTLCEQIREFDSHTPVVFFSGAAYEQDKEKALAAGAQAYITKPAAMEEVIRVIRNAITNVRLSYEIAKLQATDTES
jgi:DNA-binding response OmpR family regulator